MPTLRRKAWAWRLNSAAERLDGKENSLSAMRSTPASGVSSRFIIRSSELLPAPLGPSNTKVSPGAVRKLTCCSTGTLCQDFSMPINSIPIQPN